MGRNEIFDRVTGRGSPHLYMGGSALRGAFFAILNYRVLKLVLLCAYVLHCSTSQAKSPRSFNIAKLLDKIPMFGTYMYVFLKYIFLKTTEHIRRSKSSKSTLRSLCKTLPPAKRAIESELPGRWTD